MTFGFGPLGPPGGNGLGDKILGVAVAVVTDNKDPDGLARVKLKFQWREGEEVTDWARIACLMAGNDRGSLFIPEVGDEVLVGFHLGDAADPYVIGMLWTKDQKAPKGDEDKNTIRKFKSRSGHEIIFDDNDKDGSVQIKCSKGHNVLIDDKADTITIADANSKNKIVIKGGDSGQITIASTGGADATLTMTAQGDVKIEAGKGINIKSLQVNIEADGSMKLKAGGSLNVESSGMLTLKGSMVKIN